MLYGDYEILQEEHPTVYAFTRTLGEDKMLVLLNFSQETSLIDLPGFGDFGKATINNYEGLGVENSKVSLLPYQAVILKIN
ncbi:MAG: alpha-glucosidase C-terminal domain-containing protein [Bacteroidota bacterium]